MRPMRRTERQIADEAGIRAILDRCQVCRLALWDEEGPYIVPMSYGYRWDEGGLKLYFHCAGEGRKLDALLRDPRAAFEMDADYAVVGKRLRLYLYLPERNGDGLASRGGKPAGSVRRPDLPDEAADGQRIFLHARHAWARMCALPGCAERMRKIQLPGVMPGHATSSACCRPTLLRFRHGASGTP